MRAEVEDNVMLGIATALAQNPSLAKPSPYFATVHDDGDVVVCALRTPPHKLVISRTADLSALHLEAAPERLRSGSLFVWDNDGPVSMAGWTGKTLNGVRVTFVYTPPEFRRHGYASACVAALTQRLLDEGIGIAASTPTWRIPPPTASTNRSAIVRCVTSLTMRSPSNQVLEP